MPSHVASPRISFFPIRFTIFSIVLCLFIFESSSFAVTIGSMNVSGSSLTMWNGTRWIGLMTSPLGNCSVNGRYDYSVADSTFRYCDGTSWLSLSSMISTGVGCSKVGQYGYSSADEAYQYCNGSTWSLVNRWPGYIVLTAGTYTGNLGGISGAHTACYNDLNANDWKGKSTAQAKGMLTPSNVVAFLCANNDCMELPENSKFYFAVTGSTLTGGASFTTNDSGLGPLNYDGWNDATHFGGTYTYWTARLPLYGDYWTNDQHSTGTCADWTDGTTSFNAGFGSSNATSWDRWLSSWDNCSFNRSLLCVVLPADLSAGSVTLSDLTSQTTATTVNSSIFQVTGLSTPGGVYWRGALTGNPQHRICSDAACSTVLKTWTQSRTQIANNQYLQLRMTTSGNPSTVRSNTVKIGTNTWKTWSTTTSAGGDNTPTGFNFTSLTNQAIDTVVTSNIVQPAAYTAADVSTTDPHVQFRICSDSSCSSVIYPWSSSTDPAREIVNGQYIQLQMTTTHATGTPYVGSVTIGTITPTWSVTTSTSTGNGLFLLSRNTYNGNLGGRSGADAKCLTELQTYNFTGKNNVTVDAAHVKAFMCDGTTCTNLQANKTYMFGSVADSYAGGDTFTTDGSGLGPNDSGSDNWTAITKFGSSGNNAWAWTGRAAGGSASVWPNTTATNTCTNWSTNSNGVSGGIGFAYGAWQWRWYFMDWSCNNAEYLYCFVDP